MRRFGLVVILLVLWVVVGMPRLVGAVAATPAAAGCDVDPVAVPGDVAATPIARTPDATVQIPVDGPAADPATVADLQATLDVLRACAAAGDLGRVAALFTPAGLAREVLAPEPVAIEPATPGATPAAGSLPVAPAVEPGTVDRAVVREDGSVAAYVDVGSPAPRLVIFLRDEAAGRWLIDAIAPLPAEATPARPLGAEDIPADVWDVIVATLGLTGDATITVVDLEAVDWPDTSLGCPQDGELYAQVVTSGYRITVEVDGVRTEIHTDAIGNAVTCDQ